MKYLVYGCAGFIGSHLTETLLNQGHSVVGVDNLITGREENLKNCLNNKEFHFFQWDATKKFSYSQPVDVVFNLACVASPKDYLKYPLETMDVCSLGTKNTLDMAVEKDAVYVISSTSEVYGDPLIHPQVENYNGNVSSTGERSVYDEGKRFSEALVMAYNRMGFKKTRIARIFNTYGPRMREDDGRMVPNFINQLINKEKMTIYGTGKQTRSLCYVSDMVKGLIALSKSDFQFPINLGNDQEKTVLELASEIANLMNKKIVVEYRKLPHDDPSRRRPDLTRARTILKWKSTVSLENGLQKTIEYFLSRKELVVC